MVGDGDDDNEKYRYNRREGEREREREKERKRERKEREEKKVRGSDAKEGSTETHRCALYLPSPTHTYNVQFLARCYWSISLVVWTIAISPARAGSDASLGW